MSEHDFAHLQDGVLLLDLTTIGPHSVHRVLTYHYRMVQVTSCDHVGNINLRVSSNTHIEQYAGHVGYTVFPEYRGHRYASRALRLLLPLARKLSLDPLWITCDPDNIASRRSCELAGARLIETVEVPPTCVIHKTGHPEKCRYRLDTGIS